MSRGKNTAFSFSSLHVLSEDVLHEEQECNENDDHDCQQHCRGGKPLIVGGVEHVVHEMLEHVEDVDYAYIHEVLPEKMSYNLEDLRKYSLWRDFMTMFMTVFAVLR